MKTIAKLIIIILIVPVMLLTSCEPMEEAKPNIGAPPSAQDLTFTISQDEDDEFLFIFENQSDITGIVGWNLAGFRTTGERIERRFPLPGEYLIEMTIAAKGGSATVSETLNQEDVDPGLFDNPMVLLIAGGLDNFEEGQTWAMDSMSVGHMGVGPRDGDEPIWWQAQPLDKAGVGVLYPDRMTFKLDGFQFVLENHGQSYVKNYRADNPAYSNAYEDDFDYVVDFDPPEATWSIVEENDTWFLELTPMEDKPIFPIFDVGATNNTYEITKLTEDQLWLRTVEDYEGNAWYYKFIRKGYEHDD